MSPSKPLPPNVVSPETRGYNPHEVDRELWAEAIRAYLFFPNYIKTVAPEVAKAIRAAVNNNPRLKDIIQFNAIAPGGPQRILGPVDAGYAKDLVREELWAEAIRAYMMDPNYIKTVAPKTAERIRAFANPPLRGILQFNSLAPRVGAGALAGLAMSEEDR